MPSILSKFGYHSTNKYSDNVFSYDAEFSRMEATVNPNIAVLIFFMVCV